MAEPIVFISRWRVADGRAEEISTALRRNAELLASTKPRTALFAAYLDSTRTQLRIVHAFPDPDALSVHFAGSEERAKAGISLIELEGFEILGPAPVAAIEQLQREADEAGATLEVYEEALSGFLRAPT